MNRCARLVAALAVSAALLTTAGCDKLRARDQLNKGVVAYKNLQYESAMEHFKNAIRFDPDLKVAKLYLATAYAQQFVAGVETPENLRNAQQAIDTYKDVLKNDPNNSNSLLGIAYLYMNMKKYDEAREYYKNAIAADPNNPDAYYSVAVIDWIVAKDDIGARKAKVGLKLDDPLTPKNKQVCEEIKAADGAKIDEGMKMAETAMQKRDDYDDAMAYLNLLYRRKADTECGNPDAAIADTKLADDWVNKAMAARKKKAEAAAKKTSGGIVIDQPDPSKKK
jgi:tetratricopeptide (TPR) repeat protein